MKKGLYWLLPLFPLFAFLPQILSTTLGKPLFIRALETRLSAHVAIETVSLSWLGPQVLKKISLSNGNIEGEIEAITSEVVFWKLGSFSDSFQIEQGSFSFPSQGGGKITSVHALLEKKEIQATGTTPQGGSLSLKGTVSSKKDFDLVFHLQKIPTGALSLFTKKGLLRPLLGPLFDLKGECIYREGFGSLWFDLLGDSAKANLRGAIQKGSFILKEPLLATFHLSPELIPSLGIEGKNPVTLEISPEGFSFPLSHFSLNKVEIGHAVLNAGKIQIQVPSPLSALLALLKRPPAPTMEIWLTPIFFQCKEGVLKYERIDALLDRTMHLCSWGQIELSKERLDCFLGLPADTLQSSFGIEHLPRNYVLKMPVRGTIQDPEIETKKAATKIATLVATQQIPKLGGSKGKAIGGLLHVFTQPEEDSDVPPPKRPFPWD